MLTIGSGPSSCGTLTTSAQVGASLYFMASEASLIEQHKHAWASFMTSTTVIYLGFFRCLCYFALEDSLKVLSRLLRHVLGAHHEAIRDPTDEKVHETKWQLLGQ